MAEEFEGFEDDTFGLEGGMPVKAFPPKSNLRTAEQLATQFPNQSRKLKCADCGSKLVLKDGKYGIFYGCVKFRETGCPGAHNCNKTTAEPLGFPANSETRKLRREAHEVFDKLWQAHGLKKISRQQAYEWMQKHLKLSEEDAHIAKLDKVGCEKLIQTVDRFLNPPTRFDREDPI